MIILLVLTGCRSVRPVSDSQPSISPTVLPLSAQGTLAPPSPTTVGTSTSKPFLTEIRPSPSPTPTTPPETATTTPTATPEPFRICSPVKDLTFNDILATHISNPYNPPSPGSDSPHHGIDIAVFKPGTWVAIGGSPVQSILTGRVAAVLQGSFPFGYGIIIESPLENYPAAVVPLPTPVAQTPLITPLTCPWTTEFPLDSEERSMYVLYAHLELPVELAIGDNVACGEEIGYIGESGNAYNPHVHLETRVGPAGMNFGEMSHYFSTAPQAEMESYCLWRVSGEFQFMDPTLILGLGQD